MRKLQQCWLYELLAFGKQLFVWMWVQKNVLHAMALSIQRNLYKSTYASTLYTGLFRIVVRRSSNLSMHMASAVIALQREHAPSDHKHNRSAT